MADQAGLKQVPERAESTVSSVTMADQAGLKLIDLYMVKCTVQQP